MTDQPTLTIDDVIRDFRSAGYTLPRASMQWALDNWAAAVPSFLELLSRYADGTDRSKETADALFFIIHLLGEKAETAAFGDLCRLLWDRRAARIAIGDAVTTTLRQILISTFDGDVAALRSVVEAAKADEFIRDTAILAVAYLTRIGRIPEADTVAWLRHLLSAMRPQAECYVWVGWTECAATLGLADFAADVQRLFERGFIDRYWMSYGDFEQDLQLTLDDPDRMAGLADKRLAPFTGAIDDLSKWHSFSGQDERDLARQEERDQARQEERDRVRQAERRAAIARQDQGSAVGERNKWRHVGRNDPCPCGSGMKFKKCSLGKSDAERPVASVADCLNRMMQRRSILAE